MEQQRWVERAKWVEAQLADPEAVKKYGYLELKDDYWNCIRKAKGAMVNPVGFWHAGMSN